MMAKQHKTIGTGITAREVVTYDGEDMPAAFAEFASQWNANWKEGGGNYGAVSLNIIKKCHRFVANSVRPYETDSPADFAERILRYHRIAQAAIKRGDADTAARFTFEFAGRPGNHEASLGTPCAAWEKEFRGRTVWLPEVKPAAAARPKE